MLQDEKRKNLGTWTIILFVVTLLVLLAYYDHVNTFLYVVTALIGFAFYHVAIRLAISWVVAYMPEDYFNWRTRYYRRKPFEKKFYKKIRVADWESYLPHYMASDFQLKDDASNAEEVLFAMCEDEMIHTINAIFSLLSIVIAPIVFHGLGLFIAFLVLGLLLTIYELAFVVSQRYDRRWLIVTEHLADEPKYLR